MTDDLLIALSFVPTLSRAGLIQRLKSPDPELWDLAARHLPRVAAARRAAEAAGIKAVPWHSPVFPSLLLATADCPPVLWAKGDVAILRASTVAIVGSRAATPVGCEIAATMAADLAGRGIVVVSGLARGIDSAAHRGAMEGGLTVAVLGSGIDRVYPSEHEALAGDISERGALLSEYAPGTPPRPFRFPQRNRLISGLSLGVVVIEAAQGSGSLITASSALDQGREVMVVPGNVLSGRNRGGHALIRDGAKIVETADDIVLELGLVTSPSPAPSLAEASARPDPVLRAMEAGEVYELETLTSMLGMPASRLLARLLELELGGEVRRIWGGRFVRPRRTC